MRRIHIYIILAIMSFSALSCTEKAKPDDTPAAIDTIPTLITQVKKCSRLYTAEYKIHKIITHNDEVRAKGKILNHEYDVALPVGERKVAIPVDATIKAYIDFGDFSERNIKRNGRKMEILLPDPHVQLTASRINHGEIRKYVAMMRQNFSDAELANYEQQGRKAIINDIPRLDITDMAKESATKIIVPFFVGMGFDEEDITVTFRKDFTAKEIIRMVDPTTEIEGK